MLFSIAQMNEYMEKITMSTTIAQKNSSKTREIINLNRISQKNAVHLYSLYHYTAMKIEYRCLKTFFVNRTALHYQFVRARFTLEHVEFRKSLGKRISKHNFVIKYSTALMTWVVLRTQNDSEKACSCIFTMAGPNKNLQTAIDL